ncbi:hypothetical protein FSP39_009195 [Pinctada imbricata]|uniref:Sulfotransferase domain-containing protein n=1 Tax=Pinctada imbricata TaxID=66713 RepID=A0AA89C733_PINIB|nr:hypothetical protein FSP39_009195 [Pinctada imbricata]
MDEQYLREGRFHHTDGDIEFDFLTVDGIGLPSFCPSYTPGGFSKRIKDIIDLDCRKVDIILATYQKCDMLYGTWFDYEKEMAIAKESNKNIHTIHYEELKKNPIKEIEALSSFLKIEATDTLLTDIATKCSFENLKKADEEIKVFPNEIFRKPKRGKGPDEFRKKPNSYRKGIVGDWKSHFTVAQNEQFDNFYEAEMKNAAVRVVY